MSETWKWVLFSDTVHSLDSKRIPIKSTNRTTGPYPYWGASGVVDHVSDYIFDHPTLLISEDGENLRSRKTPIAFYVEGKYWVNNHAHVFLAKEGYDLRFLSYLMEQIDVGGFITGSTQPKLTAGALARIPINVPSLEEQKRIASLLGSLDDQIQKNLKLVAICSELCDALWKRNQESTTEVVKLSDLSEVVLGGTPSRKVPEYWNGTIPWINSGKVNEFRITKPSELITTLGLENSSTKLMPKGTTVIAITGATLGQVSRLELDACGNQSIVGVFTADEPLNNYLFQAIKENVDVLVRSATGGAQQHINKANVEELYIPLLDEKLLREWHSQTQPLFQTVSELLFECNELISTRDELLPLLLSGEIKVKDVAA